MTHSNFQSSNGSGFGMNRVIARGTVSQDRDIRLVLGQLRNTEMKSDMGKKKDYLKDTTELLYN